MANPLDLSIPIAPSSSASTGSDVNATDKEYDFEFGGISVGGGAGANSWISGLVRDAVVAALAGLTVRYLWSKIK